MPRRKQIEIGQHYRTAGDTAFGKPMATVWKVQAILQTNDRLAHVRLVDISDEKNVKTVSAAALSDPSLYVPVRGRDNTGTAEP